MKKIIKISQIKKSKMMNKVLTKSNMNKLLK